VSAAGRQFFFLFDGTNWIHVLIDGIDSAIKLKIVLATIAQGGILPWNVFTTRLLPSEMQFDMRMKCKDRYMMACNEVVISN